MKLYAFEVRDDERPYFEAAAKEHQIDITLFSEFLTDEILPSLEPGSGVSVLGMRHYGEKEMDALSSQKITLLSTRTIGYNHIDLEAAKKYGIHVCNASYAPNGVAEYTLMMMLLCLRNYKQALWRSQVNDFSLTGLIGRELRNLTVGVIGTGRIGSAVIRCLSGFGCRILTSGRHLPQDLEPVVIRTELSLLLAESDLITLHVPLTPETHHMINRESLSRMKDGVILINCARGGLMDISALIEGIESEKIGALGIDCIETEETIVHQNHLTDIIRNPQMAYLRQFKNVIHTQHMAFYTEEAVESMVQCGVEGLLQMRQGIPCPTQLV